MKAFFFLFLLLTNNIFLFAQKEKSFAFVHDAVVRGDLTKKELALVFTADETGEGLPTILKTLKEEKVKASFFFTGRFYRNASFQPSVQQAKKERHYLGPHSDGHLLYCDWNKRDSLLVTKDSFANDLEKNLRTMKSLHLPRPRFFIPPFEWWNDSIAAWSKEKKLLLFNFTPGIRTATDYTWPELNTAYKSSEWIMNWLKEFAATNPTALNGAIILLHAGTDERRKDKFYNRLREMIRFLKMKGYAFKRIDQLLN